MPNLSTFSYWSLSSEDALSSLHATPAGLTDAEAAKRLKQFGENSIKAKDTVAPFILFLNQFRNPIMIILS